jgi:serine acetyltransferase
MLLTPQLLPDVLKHWFSKTIVDASKVNLKNESVFKKAMDIFETDYQRYFPGQELYLDNVLKRAELQGTLTYRIARECFLAGDADADWYGLLGRYLSAFELYYSAEIGHSLKLNHGMGTVVGARVKLGNNVLLHQQVTFGDKDNKRPVVGDNVIVYAGARILGGITVGNNTLIGANTVCFIDVPDNSIAVGAPAKILTRK